MQKQFTLIPGQARPAAAAVGLRLVAYYSILAAGKPAACSTLRHCFNNNM